MKKAIVFAFAVLATSVVAATPSRRAYAAASSSTAWAPSAIAVSS